MAFGKRVPTPDDPIEKQSSAPVRRRKLNWLKGGIFCLIIGVVNIVYYSQTGKIILGPQSRGGSTPAFDLTMSVLVLVFGAVAIGIHHARSRD